MAKGLKEKGCPRAVWGKTSRTFDEGELEKQVTAVRLFPTLHAAITSKTDGVMVGDHLISIGEEMDCFSPPWPQASSGPSSRAWSLAGPVL
jgi:hypothetical protein